MTGAAFARRSAAVISRSSLSLAPPTAAVSASTTIGLLGAGSSVVSTSTRHSRALPFVVRIVCAVGRTAASPRLTTRGRRAAQSGARDRSPTSRLAPSGPSRSVNTAMSEIAVTPKVFGGAASLPGKTSVTMTVTHDDGIGLGSGTQYGSRQRAASAAGSA